MNRLVTLNLNRCFIPQENSPKIAYLASWNGFYAENRADHGSKVCTKVKNHADLGSEVCTKTENHADFGSEVCTKTENHADFGSEVCTKTGNHADLETIKSAFYAQNEIYKLIK